MTKASKISESKTSKSTASSKPDFAKASTGKPTAALRSAQGKPLTMEELLSATGYNIPALKRGQEVTGKVISVSPQELLLDIGAKSEGIIFGRELSSVRDLIVNLSVGDEINATVVYPENDAGQVVLSLRKHSGEKRWTELEDKFQSGEDIEVLALEANRGGIICEWMGIRGFLPASQLSQGGSTSQLTHQPFKLGDLIGKNLWTKVIELDKSSNRLILSQKEPDKKDIGEILELLSKVNIGEKYSGIVTAILPFGVFVELSLGNAGEKKKPKDGEVSKLEGLVHISEISWEKVEDPGKMFKVGDKVDVMVIAKDQNTGRLNLSVKQLGADPFSTISEKYSKDQEVVGIVSKTTSYGIVITLGEGIEGIVATSKIPQNETWEMGKQVEFIVDSIDAKSRRINLVPIVREKPVLYR